MKTISRWIAVSYLTSLVVGTAAHAHGLHAEVEPRFHGLVHLLQLAGVVVLALGIGFWMRHRTRRTRDDSSRAKPR
jgi:cytochrome c-type biogenesis protein CcmH/NrfF